MTPLAFGLWLVLLQPATEVLVEGNVSVAEETILHYVGSPSNEDEIQESFQRLWDSGLFEDLRFERRGTALVVIVNEKPLLAQARFEGETISEEDVLSRLREAGIRLHKGRPFGVDDTHEAERVTGLVLGPDFRVTARLEPVSETRVDLVLLVEDVSKPRVARIVFEGREALPEPELRNAMRLAPSSFASLFTRRDRFDAVLLEQDLDRLRSLYRNRGFAGAQVGPASTQTDSDGRTTIVMPIFEGARYRLGEIEIDAGPLLSRNDVADWLPESEQTPSFDASRIEALVERLEGYYRARGYPAIEVEQRETARASGDTIDVRLVVRQGGFYLVGRIEFRGNERHRDRDLRRYVDLVEGERFDQRRLESGERNLMSLGNFRHVAAEVDFASRPGDTNISLPELLTRLSARNVSVRVNVKGSSDAGRVYLDDGNVVHCECGTIRKEKALFRLLAVRKGSYEIEELPPSSDVPNTIASPTESLVIEGLQQNEALERLMTKLPPLVYELAMNEDCKKPVSLLSSNELEIYQDLIRYLTIMRVLEESPFSDFNVLQLIYGLVSKGFFRVTRTSGALLEETSFSRPQAS